MGIKEYVNTLYNNIPNYIYETLISIAIIGVITLFIRKGMGAFRYITRLLLVEYIGYIILSTIIFRNTKIDREYNYTLFWSYGHPNSFMEIFLNVVAFIPLGILLREAFVKIPIWKVTIFGFIFSIIIETLQFLLKKGFSETDDVIHNTLGCVIGAVLSLFVTKLWNFFLNYCKLHLKDAN